MASTDSGGEPTDAGLLGVGLAQVDVTPEEPIRLGGYGARTGLPTGVADTLRAKALAVGSAPDDAAVLVTADLIGFDGLFADAVCKSIGDRTGLQRGQIILNASHTHAGPIFGIAYPPTHGLSSEQPGSVRSYTQMLHERLVEMVVAALADLRPRRLSWGLGVASFVMNRREATPDGIRIGFNPRGYVDRSVPVLRVEELDGSLRGIVFGYACHNTTLMGDNLRISADYAGFAQRYVESQCPGTQAMFLQGCGGSATPYPRGAYGLARQHGEALGVEVCRVLAGEFQPVRGPLRVAFDHVDLPLEPQPTPEDLDTMRRGEPYEGKMADKVQQMIDEGGTWATHYRAPMSAWQFGQDLTLMGLPAEVVGEYVPLLARALGPRGLWLAGYCNDYFGYMPTAHVHDEGGYEGHELITGFGFLSRDTEAVVLAKARELAARAGRNLPPIPRD